MEQLIEREATPAVKEANRNNSQKSTGPKTEKGKRNTRVNAYRHGLFARELAPWRAELGEDSALYQRHRRRFQQAFEPRDGVEELLVDDLAQTRWRLDRLLKAESAHLAYQRGQLVNQRERHLAGEGMGVEAAFDKRIYQLGGYSSLPPSEGNFEMILMVVRTLRAEVEDEGYTEYGEQCLQLLYGQEPGLAKTSLMVDYRGLKPGAERTPEMQQRLRQSFLDLLKVEEERFEALQQCLREERGPLFEMKLDTQLMLSEKAAKVAAAEENRLRSYFDKGLKQLMAWRQPPRQAGSNEARVGPNGVGPEGSTGRAETFHSPPGESGVGPKLAPGEAGPSACPERSGPTSSSPATNVVANRHGRTNRRRRPGAHRLDHPRARAGPSASGG